MTFFTSIHLDHSLIFKYLIYLITLNCIIYNFFLIINMIPNLLRNWNKIWISKKSQMKDNFKLF